MTCDPEELANDPLAKGPPLRLVAGAGARVVASPVEAAAAAVPWPPEELADDPLAKGPPLRLVAVAGARVVASPVEAAAAAVPWPELANDPLSLAAPMVKVPEKGLPASPVP